MEPLTFKQDRFVFEYVRVDDGNGTSAAIRAGYSASGASVTASRLLADPKIQEAIQDRKEADAYVATLDRAWVLRRLMMIADADPAELVRVTVKSCPNCYDAEMRELLAGPLSAQLNSPNPDCKTCLGDGVRFVQVADTSKLSPAARRLYAGAQQTKDGIKVLMRDQDGALMTLARILGMVKDKSEISGPDGGPIPLQALSDPKQLTEAQLEAIVAAQMGTLGVGLGVPALPAPLTIEGSLT